MSKLLSLFALSLKTHLVRVVRQHSRLCCQSLSTTITRAKRLAKTSQRTPEGRIRLQVFAEEDDRLLPDGIERRGLHVRLVCGGATDADAAVRVGLAIGVSGEQIAGLQH